MSRLTSKSHTPRTIAHNPAQRSADALSGRVATHDAIDLKPVIDPATMPERYIVRLDGDCLEPLVMNGAQVVIERDAKIACGDLVLLFFKPEHVPGGKYQTILKRVVMAPPPYVKFPYREHPDSEVHALVVVEMLNPYRTFAYKCEHLLGIHKCVGPVPADATYIAEQKSWHIPSLARTIETLSNPAHGGDDYSPTHVALGGKVSRRSIMNMLVKSSTAVALAAVSPAIANADWLPVLEAEDPVITLADQVLEAWEEFSAACAHLSLPEEAMFEWRKKNPMPERPSIEPAEERDLSIPGLNKHELKIIKVMRTLRAPEDIAEQQHRAEITKWKRREKAAERRTGFAQARRSEAETSDRASELIGQLCETQPRTLAGLAAKARVARRIHEGDLECSISHDVGAMAGEIDEGARDQQAA